MKSGHQVPACEQMGHHYLNIMIVACPHLQADRVVLSVWMDRFDEPDLTLDEAVEFGPFDTAQEVRAELHRMLDAGLGHLLAVRDHTG